MISLFLLHILHEEVRHISDEYISANIVVLDTRLGLFSCHEILTDACYISLYIVMSIQLMLIISEDTQYREEVL